MKKNAAFYLACLIVFSTTHAQTKWKEESKGSFSLVTNAGGQPLGYSASSGVKLLTLDGFAFKDLNKNGKLDKYEDWRLSFDVRAKDLASKMTTEEIAGLMLYSRHQAIPTSSRGFFAGTYNGKKFEESGARPFDLSDQQKEFLVKDNVRHVLVTSVQNAEVAAAWNNNVQALVEGIR